MRTIFDTKALYASLTDEQRERICTAAIDREIMSHGRDEIMPGRITDFTRIEDLCEWQLHDAVRGAIDLREVPPAEFPLPSCVATYPRLAALTGRDESDRPGVRRVA